MSAKKKAPVVPFRLPAEFVAPFLAARGWSIAHIAEGRKVWRTNAGPVPLTVDIVEAAISFADPVAWAYLNLIEPRDLMSAETGEVVVPKGSPWVLMPKQQRMARLSVNAVIEAAAETGKTRNIIGKSLWRCATIPGSKVLIACASQTNAEEIAVAAEWQANQNPTIGGGLTRKLQKAPFYALAFANGSEIQLRLVGAAGEQLRGFHGSAIFGDECAIWRSTRCFTELYRAAEPGAVVQLFSTHNGDRASAWYGIVARAKAIDGREGESFEETVAAEAEPGFVKLRIARPDLPLLWGPKRKAEAVALYGGEQTSAYRQNILGEVGDQATSIFPASLLEPCLSRQIHEYRVVVAAVNRDTARVGVRVARLSGTKLGAAEEMVADEEVPLLSDADFGRFVAAFIPSVPGEPLLYGCADLGSEKDPTEFVLARKDGARLTTLFRLHLENATWPTQVALFVAADCALAHRPRWSFDAGSAGGFLVQTLRGHDLETCPICRKDSHLSERVFGFNFGEVMEAIDADTGEPLVDAEKLDNAGRPTPRRMSRKEFSTRVLEAKVQRRELVLADDDGAGDTRLGVSALMRGVSQIGVTSRGERRFDGRDDHFIDALRLLALVVAMDARDGFGGGSLTMNEAVDRGLVATLRRDGTVSTVHAPAEPGPWDPITRIRVDVADDRTSDKDDGGVFGGGLGGVSRGMGRDW